MSMIVEMPAPGSPTRYAPAPSNSASDVALERLPSLSFRRIRRMAFFVPSGRKRGIRKQVGPSIVCASTRCASLIGAEKNHLCPVIRHSPSRESSARVVFAATSLPPCFSVIPMPMVTPALFAMTREEESYWRERICGSQASARSGAWAIAATEALVMVIGQIWPASTCEVMNSRAARASVRTLASASVASQVEACSPAATLRRMSA